MTFLARQAWATAMATLVIACSGSDATVVSDTDAASDATGGDDATSDAGGDAGLADSATTDGGNGDASTGDAGVDGAVDGAIDGFADAPACPDEHGKYTIVATGLGCGDLAAAVPDCITQLSCGITLAGSASGGLKALNGDANLASNGSFSGASIKEGSVNRTGCVGSWDANASMLTVDCGGVGTAQSCRAVLTRTSLNCN